jgi:hypothetical protein
MRILLYLLKFKQDPSAEAIFYKNVEFFKEMKFD